MAVAPNYAATPRCTSTQISTANTARDGTGTVATCFAAGASGSRIDRVRINATGTTTAGVVRLFLHDGTNFRLWREVLVQAATPSTTVPVWEAEVDLAAFNVPLVLPVNWSLRAATNNAETFNVHVLGGDF